MTDTKPTLEDAIEHQAGIVVSCGDSVYEQSKLDYLRELQSIRSAELPVDPDVWRNSFNHQLSICVADCYEENRSAAANKIGELIGALKAYALKEKERADDLQKLHENKWTLVCESGITYFKERAEKAESELAAMYKAAEEHAGHELGLWPLGAVAAVGRLESKYAALRGRLMEPDEEMIKAGWEISVNFSSYDVTRIFKAMSAVALKEGE